MDPSCALKTSSSLFTASYFETVPIIFCFHTVLNYHQLVLSFYFICTSLNDGAASECDIYGDSLLTLSSAAATEYDLNDTWGYYLTVDFENIISKTF